jgi:UDP-2-acetamido-2,6-beta-L-arabino-hexul-4-ose reductase
MKVLVTGANGFIGKNLKIFLAERKDVTVISFNRDNSTAELSNLVLDVDFIFHLAGVNRSLDPDEFEKGNIEFTRAICHAINDSGRKIPIIYTSSIQAGQSNLYGNSKLAAEKLMLSLRDEGNLVHIFRLPNVFGKWGKPNYNSVVNTFCYNLTNNLPIKINDSEVLLNLVHIDDLIYRFIQLMDGAKSNEDSDGFEVINPLYKISVGDLALQLQAFKDSRVNLITERVGAGLVRALYSTYMSYLPAQSFSYPLLCHKDSRGAFVEMLKTLDCGQFSYFTAHPGITRGGHYHHSKTEKFLVITGIARFKFKHIFTHEEYELVVSGELPTVVETIPGWTHDITNIGDNDLIVMLWANEIFNQNNPDTYACAL